MLDAVTWPSGPGEPGPVGDAELWVSIRQGQWLGSQTARQCNADLAAAVAAAFGPEGSRLQEEAERLIRFRLARCDDEFRAQSHGARPVVREERERSCRLKALVEVLAGGGAVAQAREELALMLQAAQHWHGHVGLREAVESRHGFEVDPQSDWSERYQLAHTAGRVHEFTLARLEEEMGPTQVGPDRSRQYERDQLCWVQGSIEALLRLGRFEDAAEEAAYVRRTMGEGWREHPGLPPGWPAPDARIADWW